jgi:hypothetical protein
VRGTGVGASGGKGGGSRLSGAWVGKIRPHVAAQIVALVALTRSVGPGKAWSLPARPGCLDQGQNQRCIPRAKSAPEAWAPGGHRPGLGAQNVIGAVGHASRDQLLRVTRAHAPTTRVDLCKGVLGSGQVIAHHPAWRIKTTPDLFFKSHGGRQVSDRPILLERWWSLHASHPAVPTRQPWPNARALQSQRREQAIVAHALYAAQKLLLPHPYRTDPSIPSRCREPPPPPQP